MTEAPTRILIVNSNTNPRVTARVVAVARDLLPDCEIAGVTAGFGPHGIGGRADLVISALATLDACLSQTEPCDAVIVACFSDPGLAALRECLGVPVTGIGEAAFLTALQLGASFGVVTVSARVAPVIDEAVRLAGVRDRYAGVTLVDAACLTLDDPSDILLEGVERAARNGAEVAVIGGAAFAGCAAGLAARSPIPVVGSVEAAAVQALALTRLRPGQPRTGSYATPARKRMPGVSAAIARLLADGAAA